VTGSVCPAFENLVRTEIFGQLAIHDEMDQAASGINAKATDSSELRHG